MHLMRFAAEKEPIRQMKKPLKQMSTTIVCGFFIRKTVAAANAISPVKAITSEGNRTEGGVAERAYSFLSGTRFLLIYSQDAGSLK